MPKIGDILMDGHVVGEIRVALRDTEAMPVTSPNFGDEEPGTPDSHDYGAPSPRRGLGAIPPMGDLSGKAAPRKPPDTPTFRPGLTPRGRHAFEPPPHFTAQDARRAVEGRRGIDRSAFEKELDAKPWLRDKIMRIAHNEQGTHPEGTQAIIESMMNRAQMRGTSLEAQAKWTGEGGYYAQGGMGRGALERKASRAVLEKSLAGALAGSNISNFATDNSSGSLAAREMASGRFIFKAKINGETFSAPGSAEPRFRDQNYPRWLAQAQRGAGQMPEVVTRLRPSPGQLERGGPDAHDAFSRSPDISVGPRSDLAPVPELDRLSKANVAQVDPRLTEVVAAGARHLPEGYRVRINEGYNPRGHVPASQHHIPGRGALDVQIIDPRGQAIPNRGDDTTGLYTRLARGTYTEMMARHPELRGRLAWGGAFGTGGGSHVPDLMHFDIGGQRGNPARHLTNLGALPEGPILAAREPSTSVATKPITEDK